MRRLTVTVAAAMLSAGFWWGPTNLSAQEFGVGRAPGATTEYEILTSGPIHEAFAHPYSPEPVPGIVIDRQPPDLIDEIPPGVRPAGANVQWIPGYWGWDLDRQEFIWISGVWRRIPPGQQWVPGYWAEVAEGYQWVPGFWMSAEIQELTYLPYPPESQEQGPTTEPPSFDHIWIPGLWIYNFDQNRYQWRPGNWARAHDDWVWVPARYIWTPYGALFANGHWDYSLADRGVLFCPVVFHEQIAFARFRFTPSVVVDTRPILVQLFVAPRYQHYFFGDYFALAAARRGPLVPWVTFARQPGFYDPLLAHYRWSYGRQDVDFVQRLNVWNHYFVQNVNARPPRTFSEQQQFVARFDNRDALAGYALSQPLDELVEQTADHQEFHRLDDDQREDLVRLTEQMRSLQQQRAELEAPVAGQAEPREPTQARRVRLPEELRRVQRAWRGEQPEAPAQEDEAPQRPEQHEAPQPTPDQQPRPQAQPERQPGEAPQRPTAPLEPRRDEDRDDQDVPRRPGIAPDTPRERPQATPPGRQPAITRPGERPPTVQPGDRPGLTQPDERRPGEERQREGRPQAVPGAQQQPGPATQAPSLDELRQGRVRGQRPGAAPQPGVTPVTPEQPTAPGAEQRGRRPLDGAPQTVPRTPGQPGAPRTDRDLDPRGGLGREPGVGGPQAVPGQPGPPRGPLPPGAIPGQPNRGAERPGALPGVGQPGNLGRPSVDRGRGAQFPDRPGVLGPNRGAPPGLDRRGAAPGAAPPPLIDGGLRRGPERRQIGPAPPGLQPPGAQPPQSRPARPTEPARGNAAGPNLNPPTPPAQIAPPGQRKNARPDESDEKAKGKAKKG